ncbi:unnamed protein product [Trichobilharzia regenti]|nr:unnamed protein product [Trichobilharzia regenti]
MLGIFYWLDKLTNQITDIRDDEQDDTFLFPDILLANEINSSLYERDVIESQYCVVADLMSGFYVMTCGEIFCV